MSQIETSAKETAKEIIQNGQEQTEIEAGTKKASFERYTFPNGLTLLTKEVHSAPVVSFWVWYRVGARNEHGGITGISHWVEHMMFKGTPNLAKGQVMQLVAENGGTVNAFTSDDWTAYYETLPSDRLELALRIETDRMGNSLFDPEEVASERTVIISEREGSENEPDRLLDEEVSSAAFKAHPYGNSVIGWKCDLRTMTRDDLYNHYKTYYVPNNATVVVVGDFDTAKLVGQVQEGFEGYKSSDVPEVRAIEPEQLGERRVMVESTGSTAQIEVVYHVPSVADPDVYPLIVADALLSGAKPMGFGGAALGRSARLYRALVTTQIAASAGSYFSLHKDPHVFAFAATAYPGDDVENAKKMEEALLEQVRKLQDEEIPKEEVDKAVRQSRAQFVYSSDSASSQAFMLGFLESIYTANMYDEVLDKLAAVAPEDVQRVARTYFTEQNRTVGWFVPKNESENGVTE
jgi:zinc protease